MKRKLSLKKSIASVLALCIMLAGCSGGADTVVSDSTLLETQENSSEGIIVAEQSDSSEETNEARLVQVMGDSIYTASWSYDYDAMKQTDCKIFLQQGDNSQAELLTELEEGLIYFLVGGDGAIYYFYSQRTGDDVCYYLRKDAPDSGTEYCREIVPGESEKGEGLSVRTGAVSDRGEVCFISPEGSVYLFDAEGNLLCGLEHSWSQSWQEGRGGAVNYGGELYLYEISEESMVALWSLDFAEGAIGRKEYLIAERQPIAVFSGYENGLYLSDDQNLWNYLPENNVGTAVLEWSDSNVNLTPDFVEQLGILDEGNLFVLYWDAFADKYGQAVIREKDASDVKVKQNVVIGIQRSGQKETEDAVKAFNKFNQDYHMELLVYDNYTEFHEDLLKGQGADLFELSGQSVQMLAEKGILEDLGPWFSQSENLQEDLLPRIRDASTVNGKMVCAIPYFYILVLLTEEGVTEDGGWTIEDFLELGKSNPESKLTEYDEKPVNLLLNHLCVAIGNYVDWENRECHFDNGTFAELLEELKANSQNKYTGEIYETKSDSLFYKETLVLSGTVGRIENYLQIKEAFSGFGEIAGYPNLEGKPWYRLYMNQIYGMNNASKCKEGAWAFLEFLFSEEYQEQLNYFPALQEMLERQFADAEESMENVIYTNFYNGEQKTEYPEFTEEDKDFIRYMIDHVYWDNSTEVRDIQEIIMEEVPYYFDGDKSPEEVARTIQNRVGLYLNE